MPAATRSPRAQVQLPCTLRRKVGSPIPAHTVEISPQGMRVTSPRPLAVDEPVSFDLPNLDIRVAGSARVMRQERVNIYALRFEALPKPMERRLFALAINGR